ncbi:hypothetical protein TNIN_408821, partial [Trichonephila inaurata madagascariensis]
RKKKGLGHRFLKKNVLTYSDFPILKKKNWKRSQVPGSTTSDQEEEQNGAPTNKGKENQQGGTSSSQKKWEHRAPHQRKKVKKKGIPEAGWPTTAFRRGKEERTNRSFWWPIRASTPKV